MFARESHNLGRPMATAILFVALALSSLTVSAESALTITDIRGREVVIQQPVRKLAIDDGRFLIALSLITSDPVSFLTAWPHDINRLGDDMYATYRQQYPQLDTLARIPSSAAAFNVESVLSAAPDVLVVSAGTGPTEAQVAQLQRGGVPVVFIDFFTNPFVNLEPSLGILASLTGSEQKAEEFIEFRRERMARISERIAQVPADERPTVFLEPHAGMSADCCSSPGRGNMGDYIDFVGGNNIGAEVIPQAFGVLSLEYVIASDPDVYIATGGPHLERTGGLVLGAAYSEQRARESLKGVSSRTGITFLSAVANGRTHGFSHQLINSPVDIVAIEVFARWVHPELFADIDPVATLNELNTRFLQVPYEGVYWVDID